MWVLISSLFSLLHFFHSIGVNTNKKKNTKQKAPEVSQLNFFHSKLNETVVLQSKLDRAQPWLWVSTCSDKVFSFKKTYGYFWWQGQKVSYLALLPSLRESIQCDSLYLHKRCFPRIDNGLKDLKVSSIMAINYFHSVIFIAKMWPQKGTVQSKKSGTCLVIPGHQSAQVEKKSHTTTLEQTVTQENQKKD